MLHFSAFPLLQAISYVPSQAEKLGDAFLNLVSVKVYSKTVSAVKKKKKLKHCHAGTSHYDYGYRAARSAT